MRLCSTWILSISTAALSLGGCRAPGSANQPGGATAAKGGGAADAAGRGRGAARVIPSNTPRPQSKKLRIVLIAAAQDPLFPAARNGAAQAARQMGWVQITSLVPATAGPAEQARLLQRALAQRVDGILISPSPSPLSPAAGGPGAGGPAAGAVPIQAAVDGAARAKVPVVTLGNDLPRSRRATYCGLDEAALGEAAGGEAIGLLQKKGRLAILAGRRGDAAQEARLRGARQALKGAPEVRLAGVFYCDNNPRRAAQLMANLSRGQQPGGARTGGARAGGPQPGGARPDGWLVLGNWPLLAGESWAAAVPGRTKIVALDPLPATWRWIQSKRVQVCLGPKPFTWGEEGLKLLVKAIDGEKLPPSVDVGFERVTPETLSTYQALWQRTNQAPTPAAGTSAPTARGNPGKAPKQPTSKQPSPRQTAERSSPKLPGVKLPGAKPSGTKPHGAKRSP